MFSKISRKIKLNVIIFLILFVIIESFVVTYSINHITYRNFVTYAAESVDLSIKNCTFYIDLAMNAADNIASDEHLIDKVKDNTYSLNSLKLSAASIMGVTLYDTTGHEYHSYEISAVLPLSRMLENEAITISSPDLMSGPSSRSGPRNWPASITARFMIPLTASSLTSPK